MTSRIGKRSRADVVDSVDLEQEFGEGELKEKLLKGGLRVSPCGGHYVVEDVHQLVRELRIGIIVESSASSSRIDGLMASLEQSWSDVDKFRRSLVPFRSPGESTGSKFLFGRDTLVKVLLAIDSLQTRVLNVLLQRIPELSMDEGSLYALALLACYSAAIAKILQWKLCRCWRKVTYGLVEAGRESTALA
mmetsp:Transcript_19784/g.78797  ORF Transcript_19784/g.78797 Transcript_19784/m.78797 type:complete len:191 (-) Transcript_19784:4702-5274(-)